MAEGTVKSFNPSKGYGFIRLDLGGKDVFVHLSAVQKAGLKDLRKGQKINFEIFENRGKAAAKNLSINRSIKNVSKGKLVSIQNGVVQNARCGMSPRKADQIAMKRKSITRAALELTIAEAVRQSDPQCGALITVMIERVVPKSPGGANWAVKGVKYAGRSAIDAARQYPVVSKNYSATSIFQPSQDGRGPHGEKPRGGVRLPGGLPRRIRKRCDDAIRLSGFSHGVTKSVRYPRQAL